VRRGSKKPSELRKCCFEFTKPKLTNRSGLLHKRGTSSTFTMANIEEHFKHNYQSCRLRTLARRIACKNRTYHQTNPAWRVPATEAGPASLFQNLNHAITLELILYIVLSTVFSIFVQSERPNEFVHVLYIQLIEWDMRKERRDD
jgi:hypothetical protein